MAGTRAAGTLTCGYVTYVESTPEQVRHALTDGAGQPQDAAGDRPPTAARALGERP
ncbi:hypothetical protein [Streptomyces paromomycinus]|uniref:Uncharacterized protein n=1 Tax=Streptomyces paromomycinus TaxID=92743 RepID=A0A401W904_STREY|nr:hypothetical protein [Streptomyces paromomycinus]GCD45797.1 hypothetical protein GKJPGBOP_05536 [Streptomyces paromomycinus]